MSEFYDTHAHVATAPFRADLQQVIERARVAGISRIICIATDLASSEQCIQLAEQHEPIYAVVGWHPSDANEASEDIRPALRRMAVHPKVVAIGETGLDYYHLPSKERHGTAKDDERLKQNQARIFAQQLEVAAETGLNVVIHQRGPCFDEVLVQFSPFASRVRGVFHCFAETPDNLRRILALGSLVSFTGILTYKNAQNVRDALAACPMEHFMLETDSPYLTPEPHRSQKVRRCEPAFTRETASVAAQVKGCSMEELSAATCATARRFFPKLR
jgi:TatD DNase family protein